MRVLIVGNNPSLKNPDPNVPFEGTRSGLTLTKWIEKIGIPDIEYHMINVSCRPTKSVADSQFTDGEIAVVALFAKSCDAVIALGRKVGKALTKAEVPHHEMPHPSGLNRKLNDPRYVEFQLQQCEVYLRAAMRDGADRRPDEQRRYGPAGPEDSGPRPRRGWFSLRSEDSSEEEGLRASRQESADGPDAGDEDDDSEGAGPAEGFG